MNEIRLAVVGYAGRGQGMFRLAVKQFDKIIPAAICDQNEEMRRLGAGHYPGIPVFTDCDTMLDRVPVDVLLVETPAPNHAAFCIKGLQRNLHVMSDIPCVDSAQEADQLWQVSQNSTGLFMTGANPNLWGYVETAVDLKQKGLLGDPYYVEVEYVHDVQYLFDITPWRRTYPPIKYCTHSLGPVLRLIDEDLEWVACFDTGSHVNRINGQHDAMAALFRTKSNVVVRLLVSFINHRPAAHSLRVFGTKGCFERTVGYDGSPAKTLFNSVELHGTRKELVPIPVDELRPEYAQVPGAAESHGGADYALFDKFFTAIRQRLPSPIPLREGLRMTLPGIYAAESAAQGGQLVKIKYPW